MHLPYYIARRYLRSKKSHNIINIISVISVVGVTVGTLSLIVVLSVFNGFEDLVKSLYSSFDPDFKITVKTGKTFENNRLSQSEIENLPGVISYTEVVEENALLKNKNEQFIVRMKGVSEQFLKDNPLRDMLYDGEMLLKDDHLNYSIMGYLVAYNLGIKLFDPGNPVMIYVPRRTASRLASLDQSFNTGAVIPSAVFAVQQEIDSRYIIVPIDLARELMEYSDNQLTSVELRLEDGFDYGDLQPKIEELVGSDFEVKNRFQQQVLLYRIMKSEKWAIFFILTFIIIIAAFNVTGSLSMLILDKRKDIAILFSMGASARLIKRIFLSEGIMISFLGASLGLILGFILCYIQMTFGLIRLGDANAFIVPYYPVEMQLLDFIAVFVTVIIIGVLSSWYPVRQISRKYLHGRVSEFAKTQ
jgi:lipoprotein-releasing system permease protein